MDWRARLSPEFSAAARQHALDVALMVLLFVGACLMAGRVWRFPFDDEIYTLALRDSYSPLRLLTAYWRETDVHPALSYLLVEGLQRLGLTAAAMRLVSLGMTAAALALFQLLTLSFLARPVDVTTRLAAVLLFGLCPLAIGQGDALRWYPLFALLIALFVTLYVAGGNRAARLGAAVALGVAGSTNLLAGPVAVAFAIYRYGLQRRFRAGFDLAFWLLLLGFGCLGLMTAGSLLFVRHGAIANQLGNGVLRSMLTDLLGFFGGDTLGLSQSWILVPAIAIAVLAIFGAVDRQRPADPAHLLLLMLATAALSVVAGFAKPRSFLYLAPVVAMLMTLYLDRLLQQGQGARALAMLVAPVIASAAMLANINFTTDPFKRNAAIPYATVLDFVRANRGERTLVASTDPVVPWELRVETGDAFCVSYFLRTPECFADGRSYDTVILVRGHSDRSASVRFMRRFDAEVARMTAGRQKLATLHAGLDRDAALKTRLTGTPLDQAILTIELYR